jgi:catechol 2,3-dioxygenase
MSGRVTLGAGGRPMLVLEGDPAFAPRDPGVAGLFHVALLLPSRADLARWLAHAGRLGLHVAGASDHGVSEAIYLADPEGNGIEIYADKPVAAWPCEGGALAMTTEPLDLPSVLEAGGGGSWTGMPSNADIGHVHLQVGDLDLAEQFYGSLLGFEVTTRSRGATFFGAGGYHHQLAANAWKSAGAGKRPEDAAGLREVELIYSHDTAPDLTGVAPIADTGLIAVADAWGMRFLVSHGRPLGRLQP